tara:strand:- start:960 stop:1442 length:483 start_codon:yes stop_codon:yes gene_type:complete
MENINDFINNTGFLPMSSEEHKTINVDDNLYFNKYYDSEKLNYDIIEKKEDDIGEYMDKTNINFKYLEWFYNQDIQKGMEWYETYRSDIPFIDRIGYYLVRKDLDNPIKKFEKKELKKIVKDFNKKKKQKEEEERVRLLKLMKSKDKQLKVDKGKYVLEF